MRYNIIAETIETDANLSEAVATAVTFALNSLPGVVTVSITEITATEEEG
ncbi:hypothetical protein SEA_ZHENGYI_36 [Microbacterium phage Zhengyi]|nr:hypothetical protein SEA_ZHENGYI_36 [Microbacterium phage Zhengyi]QYC53806.1 hypothetical protein SEA_EUGENEKRABS_36 [Microbacterium phage EugeneKrabs]